jgi:tetratricopeptide (TPR) repeat protein
MVPLLLERATVLHGLGDAPGAMADLDALLDRASRHVEALRFRADLAFNAGEVELAVQLWRRCLGAETRPQRRAEIELQLAKVLAENVNDVAGAIENLERVIETMSGDDIQLRERLLGLCLRANDWERATRELRALARLRPTAQDKAREELRLGLMLRDRLNDRTAARLALDRARTLDPLNLDVVRELAELLDPPARAQVLAATASNFRTSIMQNPRNAALYDRLAQVTGWQSDVDARWLSLVGLEAMGTPTIDQRQVLEQGRNKLGLPIRNRLDDAARKALRGGLASSAESTGSRAGGGGGALVDLWRAIAPAVQVATGIDVAKLGFARSDKVALKKLGPQFEPLATALACFGIEDVELYISASRIGVARALAAETPILCIGADLASGKAPTQRWLLGRTIATLAEGLATLPDLRDGELGWTFAAAIAAVDLQIPRGIADEAVGEDASIAERAKVVKKTISRKAKAIVQQIVQQKTAELTDVAGFRAHALAVGHRAGLVWAGDLAVALAQLDVGKGGKSIGDSPAALELTGWSVSDEHARVREILGVGLRGAR